MNKRREIRFLKNRVADLEEQVTKQLTADDWFHGYSASQNLGREVTIFGKVQAISKYLGLEFDKNVTPKLPEIREATAYTVKPKGKKEKK